MSLATLSESILAPPPATVPGWQAALSAVAMLTEALRGERFVTRAEVDAAEAAIARYFENRTQKGVIAL